MSTPASQTSAAKSYRPSGYNMSPGLKQARMPFAIRNTLTGGGLLLFITGVYFYSISAVKQDDFADVQDLLPPPSARANIKTIEEELAEKKKRGPIVYVPTPVGNVNDSTPGFSSSFTPASSSSSKDSITLSTSSVSNAIAREAKAFGTEATVIAESIADVLTGRPSPIEPTSTLVNETPKLSSDSRSSPLAQRGSIEEQMRMFRVPIFSGRTGNLIGVQEQGLEGGRMEPVNVDRLGKMGVFETNGTQVGGKRMV